MRLFDPLKFKLLLGSYKRDVKHKSANLVACGKQTSIITKEVTDKLVRKVKHTKVNHVKP